MTKKSIIVGWLFVLFVVCGDIACRLSDENIELIHGNYFVGYLKLDDKKIVDDLVVDYHHEGNFIYGVRMPSTRVPCKDFPSATMIKNKSVYFLYDIAAEIYKEYPNEKPFHDHLAKVLPERYKKLNDKSAWYWKQFSEAEQALGSAKKAGCQFTAGDVPVRG